MSVFKRTSAILLAAFAVLAAAPVLRADYPAGRIEPRMVYDPHTTNSLLFGGRTLTDRATGKSYDLNETWSFDGARWAQKYPETVPPARSAHIMVWDSSRNQVVMHGGDREGVQLDDTWVYRNNNWHLVATPSSPGTRKLSGATFDSVRDRLILYGGGRISADGKKLDVLRDTWEFDGTTWTQVGSEGPNIVKPLLAYDAARNTTIMLGFNETNVISMWSWDPAARAWSELKPTLMPPCTNEAGLVYASHTRTVVLVGGVCATSSLAEEIYEWNGENWVKATTVAQVTRLFGHATAYDARRSATITYGGTGSSGNLNSTTHTYAGGTWNFLFDGDTPSPRSLFAMRADPVNKVIWMYGGVTDLGGSAADFWQYKNGDWTEVLAAGTPTTCINPLAAFDSDRVRYILYCANSDIHEFDGATMTWKSTTDTRTEPRARRFASMVYDPVLKKTVLHGGFDEVNYLNDTWTWDGTTWAEITRNRLPGRSLHMMWFDPTLRKVVAYGGLGRPSSEERVVRYDDMYTFDGTGWTKLAITATPGARYGGQVTVDPVTNKALLFGGILFEAGNDTSPGTQTFVDDIWEFDGTAWKKLSFLRVPPARENGAIEFDPSGNQLVVFGGYAGTYFSDLWTLNAARTTWTPRADVIIRRRAGSR